MTKAFEIAVLPGDGIGNETVPEGLKALDAMAALHGFEIKKTPFDWSCETYSRFAVAIADPHQA